jgi:hypothetical protein
MLRGGRFQLQGSYCATGVVVEGVVVVVLTVAMAILNTREAYEREVEICKRIDRVTAQYMDLLRTSYVMFLYSPPCPHIHP